MLKLKLTVIFLPITLIGQWRDEIRQKAPSLTVLTYHGSSAREMRGVIRRFAG